jgi:ABC-type antimicrobial peptide transport system permease subunit
MRGHLEAMSLPLELGAGAIAWFAVLALVLASIGLYGTVSYSVAQRSREVGIRLSLGAGKGAMVRLLLGGGLRLVLIGLLTGLVVGVIFGRALESLLFGITALDPITLVVVPAVLAGVGFVAAYLPARRAGKIDPVRALRAQ